METGTHQLARSQIYTLSSDRYSIPLKKEAAFGLLPFGFRNNVNVPILNRRKVIRPPCMQRNAALRRQWKIPIGVHESLSVVNDKRREAVTVSVLGSDGGAEARVLRPPCKSNLGCFLGSDVESDDDEYSVPRQVSTPSPRFNLKGKNAILSEQSATNLNLKLH